MSEAKFTKGKWDLDIYDPWSEYAEWFIESNYCINGIICAEIRNKKDAHLIAAAPEMYEALEHVLKMQLRGFIVLGNEATGKIQKSLAKARGE